MADKKISALTAATTPLAGSEVLPIVQGGSTVKVSVANLTAGRDVANKTVSVISGSLGGQYYNLSDSTAAGSRFWKMQNDVSAYGDYGLYQSTDNTGASYTARLYFDAAGNPTVSTGNLVIGTPSKGIVDSTGTTSLQFTAFQVVSNKPILAPSVATAAGNTASTPTATPVTLFTPSGDGVWIVNALVTLTGAPAAYIASSMIKASGGVLAATAISTATNMSISVSGANVQATQTSGGDQIIAFSYIRLF
jgi:hypothetical protein